MQRAITERLPERAPTDYAIYDPAQALPVVGKVVARGLSDEHADRQYLIVDGVDGLSHCVDIGIDAPATPDRSLRSEEHTSELQSLMRISYAVFCLKQTKTHSKQLQLNIFYALTELREAIGL